LGEGSENLLELTMLRVISREMTTGSSMFPPRPSPISFVCGLESLGHAGAGFSWTTRRSRGTPWRRNTTVYFDFLGEQESHFGDLTVYFLEASFREGSVSGKDPLRLSMTVNNYATHEKNGDRARGRIES